MINLRISCKASPGQQNILQCLTCVINLSMKRSGPNSDPWWTPQALSKHDHMSSQSSNCCLLSRELLSQFRTTPMISHRSPLFIHLSSPVLSNAFLGSINTPAAYLFWSKELVISSVSPVTAEVDLLDLNLIDCQSVNSIYGLICQPRLCKMEEAEKGL